KEHWLELSNKAINEAVYWVVLDHFIQYKHPAFLGEQLLVETYVENYSGPRSKRIVRFHNAAKKLVAIAETTWCMIDRSANKPKRVPEEIIDLFIPAYEEK
ncbi:MAG: hypothetical protein KI790_20425, partial [Cyclobacteriaceae bacterium]|nr:hypothetical protein [Cyclobacteriaceae bacterium HetDA_MAG_MS6]